MGLSRLLRANPEIRAITPELSIVTPDTGGLPVAFGVCEALRAKQVYWAERRRAGPPALPPVSGAEARRAGAAGGRHPANGQETSELKSLLESTGAVVVGLAVIIYQPTPKTVDFSPLAALLPGQTRRDVLQGRRVVRDVQGAACRRRKFGSKRSLWLLLGVDRVCRLFEKFLLQSGADLIRT